MNPRIKIIFGVLGGLAIFISGMNMMSECLQKAAGEKMKKILSLLTRNPVLGVIAGALTTAVLQSSSATIAVLQNFASQPDADGISSVIGLTGAIPVLLGDNIGTTITALLASIGQNKDAKRTAVAHSLFNVSGCLLFIWFVPLYAQFIQYISPKGDEDAVTDLRTSAGFIYSMFSKIMNPLSDGTAADEKDLRYIRENVVNLEFKMRRRHIDRVCKGKCSAKLTSNYNQILHNMNRMSNRYVNLADTKKTNPIEKILLEEKFE